MFNKNVFTQNDPVADLIKGINEADYKAKVEALRGNQHKIDKNKNNKIDGDDFKILRGEKKVNEEDLDEDSSVKIPTSTGTKVLGHRYGNAAKTHRDSMADPFAVVRGPGQKDIEALEKKKTKKEEIDPNVTTTDTLTGIVAGKSANPFLKAKVKLNVNEEELDELSVNTLNRVHRAAVSAGNDASREGDEGKADKRYNLAGKASNKAEVKNRAAGLKPSGQHQKEEVEMNERELSKDETAEKERIVKGMKKSLAGFKSRYGKDAKSVMYATATARAKKD
jgi:hypothetical protein